MSRLGWAVFGGGMGASVAMWMVISAFLIGGVSGAEAIHNDSRSVESVKTKLTDAKFEVHQSIRENTTASEEVITYAGGGWLIDPSFEAAKHGADFGAKHPQLIVTVARAWPYVMVFWMVGLLYKPLKNIGRMIRK